MSAGSITITDAGALTTVQDRGRVGCAHLGVPRGGALDAPAAAFGNRLVGNDPDAAVLETTMTGVAFRADAALTFAVSGARCVVTAAGHAVAWGEPVTVPAGTEVVVGPAVTGVRSYVAVAGGIAVAPVLGSRATDTLSWVGPPRVEAGAALPVGRPGAPHPVDTPPMPAPAAVLTVVPGPRLDWFAADALDALAGAPYTVAADSNRIGLRLSGVALVRVRDQELPSEPMVLGAVQVPPNGQPVVFLADHPTTGGYPVIGVVLTDSLPVCAQLRPGDQVRFTRRPA